MVSNFLFCGSCLFFLCVFLFVIIINFAVCVVKRKGNEAFSWAGGDLRRIWK